MDELVTATEASKTLSKNNSNKPTSIHKAAQEGYIDLKYLDESGCSGVPSVTAIVALESKRLEQTERRGRRISILGLWQPDEGFEYALACGSFNSSSYITVMDWVADKAAKTQPRQNDWRWWCKTMVLCTPARWLSNSGNDGRNRDYSCSSYRSTVPRWIGLKRNGIN